MSMSEATITLDWDALTGEAVRHLRALLRCDTTNPPGNEGEAITYIREQLVMAGIAPRIIEATPGRPNLWARLPGTGAQRPLLLLSHVDVVPVERDKWSVDPFGGEVRDGFIYGRGAVDMKDMTALELTLFLHFARQAQATRQPLSRDIILMAVADEETSSVHGMGWIAANMPELIDAEYALNEGGGMSVDLGGQRIYLCEAAQKGSARVTLRASGKPGHAAIPHQENAIRRLAQAIMRITALPLPMHVIPTTRRFIEILAETQKQVQRTMLQQALNPLLSENVLRLLPDQDTANGLRAMLHNTATPTILQAGGSLNVIPSEATAQLDVRIIPGQTEKDVADELRRRVRDANVAVVVEMNGTGYELSTANPLFDAITAAIAQHEPGAVVAPYLFPAVSDSRFLAPRGVIPYGFVPHRPEAGVPPVQALAHGHDERVSIANIGFGLRVLYDTISAISR